MPIFEQAILDRIDADLFYKAAALSAAVSNDGEALVYTTADTMDTARSLLRPWATNVDNTSNGGSTIEEMAARWLQQFGENNNGEELSK